ncbi:MAG: EAL domain-containing protein, partial [Sulfurimonas sp.]
MESKSAECNLSDEWKAKLQLLDIAFQPIIHINTGKIFGVEALLRNFQDIGCNTIFEVFDQVHQQNLLYCFDLALRRKAFKKFTKLKNSENIKLFYNLDNRLFDMPDFTSGNTSYILKEMGIKQENICFEISERYEIADNSGMEKILQHYKNANYCIAIDDFGVGYAGYKLLFDSTPDIIKIDRYFLQNIELHTKKKMMVKSITHLAIKLGIKVIAEGVETEKEYLTCKEIGCHFIQGYVVQKPTKNIDEIKQKYEHIVEILKKDKRDKKGGNILKYIDHIEPIKLKSSMQKVMEYFKEKNTTPMVPVINNNNEPVGVFYESQSNIIKIMHEENLIAARDQNPLTKMPGNRVVEKKISSLSANKQYILCYFDLDNFKAYNDKYGFRNGDRIIQLFADILQKYLSVDFFKGHIGGDDFFVCSKTNKNELEQLQNVMTIFTNQVKSFYSPEDRENGYILSTDRDGMKKQFHLL